MRGVATREQLHKEIDALPESEIEPVAEFIASRGTSGPESETSKPDDLVDDWGELDNMLDRAADDLMTDLDEEEIAASGETLADAWARKGHSPS